MNPEVSNLYPCTDAIIYWLQEAACFAKAILPFKWVVLGTLVVLDICLHVVCDNLDSHCLCAYAENNHR